MLATALRSWGFFSFCGGLSASEAEEMLDQFRQCARLMAENYLIGGRCELVLAAYDAGVVAGFYGSGSVIGLTAHDRFQKHRVVVPFDRHTRRLTYELFSIGNRHGASLRRCAVGGEKERFVSTPASR
jgi:hypothetical protein